MPIYNILGWIFLEMFRLQQKRKEEAERAAGESKPAAVTLGKQMSVRSRYLTQEVAEIQSCLPSSCSIAFEDVDDLREFHLTVKPEEGYWKDGTFAFKVQVPLEYNIKPPAVQCLTKLWHPNITENGKVCLSILREHSLDGTGWLPTRSLKDVVWGLNSLFTDLCDFEDPLNTVAAEEYVMSKASFIRKVQNYIAWYAKP